jgi:putative ABC transport system permease protein
MRISRQSFRLAGRSFIRNPGFAAVAILSLGLGIALNTTMYGVIDALVNPRVDMRAPGQLYLLSVWGDRFRRVPNGAVEELLKSGGRTYVGFTGSRRGSTFSGSAVEYKRRYDQATTVLVRPNYFELLGIQPEAGRIFTNADYMANSNAVVISDRLAGSLFRGGESPIGRIVDVNGDPHTVIGVVGRASNFPGDNTDMWMLPAAGKAQAIPPGIIRLRDGVTIDQANDEMAVLAARFSQLAGDKSDWFQLAPAIQHQFHYSHFDFALVASVIAILLIACANLANLQLARGIGRSRELAVRCALGASRVDIISQLMLESAMLAIGGLVAGLLLTFWGMHLLRSRIPPIVADYSVDPQPSWRVLIFAAIACLFCVMIIGLIPALRVSRVDPNELLKSGAGTGATGQHRRQYGIMVAGEIALALALLSGAALVVQAALSFKAPALAYDPTPLSDASMLLQVKRDTTLSYASVMHQIVSHARALPDVADASVSTWRRAAGDMVTANDPSSGPRGFDAPMYSTQVVSPSYFRTLHLPILAGRDFLEGFPAQPEVIVDKSTARLLWGNANPIGAQIKLGSPSSIIPWVRVVGVVANARLESPRDRSAPGGALSQRLGDIYYLPSVSDTLGVHEYAAFSLTARAKADPKRMPVTLLSRLKVPPFQVRVAWLSATRASFVPMRGRHNFVAAMYAIFAVLALGLASIGVYGIIVHSVAERRRELGVRIALGANAGQVLQAVLREGNVVALAGVALGLLITKYTMTWLHAFILEDAEYDAPWFAAMAAVLFIVVVLAALLPALRATRIDPVESLRNE